MTKHCGTHKRAALWALVLVALLVLCACANADDGAPRLTVGRISIVLPDGCMLEGDSTRTDPLEFDTRLLERRSECIALASDPDQTLMAVSQYEGASFDEALAYVQRSSEGGSPSAAQPPSGSWSEAMERHDVEAPEVAVEYGAMESLEVDGHRAARQERLERQADGTTRMQVVWECIELDANVIGVLFVRLSEEDYVCFEPLLDEILSSIRIAS